MGAASVIGTFAETALNVWSEQEEQIAREKENISNKQMADQAAGDALVRGALEGGKVRREVSQIVAAQRVAYATSGVDATTGTAARMQESTRMMGELDAQTLQNNAVREALGFKKHGIRFLQMADRDRRNSTYRTVGTALTGAGRLASEVSKYKEG